MAGANGVSNGVDQSLPALKHERAGRLSLPPVPARSRARTRIVITSRLSSSESLSSPRSRVLVLLPFLCHFVSTSSPSSSISRRPASRLSSLIRQERNLRLVRRLNETRVSSRPVTSVDSRGGTPRGIISFQKRPSIFFAVTASVRREERRELEGRNL